MSIARNKESGTVLSGGNFDFKNTSDSGYLLELRYIDNNEAVKEVVKAVRDGCGFSCIPGHNSTSCFLPDPNAFTAENDSKLQEVFDVLDERLGALKKN
ncbi:MAG: hypothetical protein MN733_09785 [Nitrososphaera sp.]|nr:hypothetical protein [Nitrososphaera sp.]